jgi:hypothetical protein
MLGRDAFDRAIEQGRRLNIQQLAESDPGRPDDSSSR